MNKVIILAVAIVIMGGGYYFYQNQPSSDYNKKDSDTVSTTISNNSTSTTLNKYTLAEVGSHKDKNSCWSVVNGSIYDLTSLFGKHKGGDDAILKICGQDGTELFNKKHGGQEKPEMILRSLLIGEIKN